MAAAIDLAGPMAPPAPSTRIAQPRRDPVDRQVNAAPHARVRTARAMALDELDLQVIERVEIREAVLDRAREQRVVGEPPLLPSALGQDSRRALPFCDD